MKHCTSQSPAEQSGGEGADGGRADRRERMARELGGAGPFDDASVEGNPALGTSLQPRTTHVMPCARTVQRVLYCEVGGRAWLERIPTPIRATVTVFVGSTVALQDDQQTWHLQRAVATSDRRLMGHRRAPLSSAKGKLRCLGMWPRQKATHMARLLFATRTDSV